MKSLITVTCPIEVFLQIVSFINTSKHIGGIFTYKLFANNIAITGVYRMRGVVEDKRRVVLYRLSREQTALKPEIPPEKAVEIANTIGFIARQNPSTTFYGYWHTHTNSLTPSSEDLMEKFHIIGGYKRLCGYLCKAVIIIHDKPFNLRLSIFNFKSIPFRGRVRRHYVIILFPFTNPTLSRIFLLVYSFIRKVYNKLI